MAVVTGCVIDESTTINMSNATYGNFIVKNVESGDSVIINDGGGVDTILAKSGQVISISFEPKEEYKNRKFTSTYTLPGGEVIRNSLNYDFKVDGWEIGHHNIMLWVVPKDVDAAAKEPATLVVEVIL